MIKVIICLEKWTIPDEESIFSTINYIAKSIGEGYTSGYYPHWILGANRAKGIGWKKQLEITLGSPRDAEYVLPKVADSIESGYKSGYLPDWKIKIKKSNQLR